MSFDLAEMVVPRRENVEKGAPAYQCRTPPFYPD
jgi:hypothetical protein